MNNEANISLYGEGAGEEFPVLKAFQQYLDAEQAKARRRLLTVSIIFVVTLIAVIAIFSVLVIKANNQTQVLNDRLVEFAMKDSDRKVQDAKAAAVQEATVKSLNDTLLKLQQQIAEQERKATAAAAAAAKELAAAKASAEAPVVDSQSEKRAKETEARIQKALALLKAEKQKLAEEKDRLHQEELERYRREHYPEYYAKKETAQKKSEPVPAVTKKADVVDVNEDDALEYFEEVKPVAKPQKVDLDPEDDAIEYFKDADSYTIPVEVKGKRAGWRVPLD